MDMRTFPDIIERFGGLSEFARAMSLNQSAASEMKQRKSIPPKYWGHLVAAAAERGISLSLAQLVRMAEVRAENPVPRRAKKTDRAA